MKSENLTVEIFRDTDRRDIAVEYAESGIDHIRRVTTGIEIIRASRLLRIARPEADVVDMTKIRWPSLDADLNLIVTNRMFVSNTNTDDITVTGMAHNELIAGTTKVAVVNVASGENPELTVAHEVGHLLNVKLAGEKWDGQDHCIDETCLMHLTMKHDVVDRYVQRNGVKKMLGKYGLWPTRHEFGLQPKANDFCIECAHQLGKNTYFLQQAKAGQAIPASWYLK